MFNFLKKKISVEEMASGLYMLFIRDTAKEPLKDTDGNIILDKNEQSLLLLSHLCDLLNSNDLKNVELHLLSFFVQGNRKVEGQGELLVEIALLSESVKKISAYFLSPPPTYHEFLQKIQKEFPFDKELNSMQKFNVLVWYHEHAKAIDSVFKSALAKFRLQADKIKNHV